MSRVLIITKPDTQALRGQQAKLGPQALQVPQDYRAVLRIAVLAAGVVVLGSVGLGRATGGRAGVGMVRAAAHGQMDQQPQGGPADISPTPTEATPCQG